MRSAHPQGVGGASAGAGGLLKLTRSSQGRPVQRLARPAGRTGRGLGPLDGTPTSNLDKGQCPEGGAALTDTLRLSARRASNPRDYNHGGLL
mgnify:FL=1